MCFQIKAKTITHQSVRPTRNTQCTTKQKIACHFYDCLLSSGEQWKHFSFIRIHRMTDHIKTKQLKKSNMHSHELMVADTVAHITSNHTHMPKKHKHCQFGAYDSNTMRDSVLRGNAIDSCGFGFCIQSFYVGF